MVDLNSLCTFVLGAGRVILGGGGIQDKAESGAKPFVHDPALSILACVFRQTSIGGGGGSARGKNVKNM